MKRRTNRRPSRPHLLAIAAMLLLLTAPRLGLKVFVADSSNSRVLRFASGAAMMSGAAATAASMFSPKALVVDAGGRLWVADSGNSRVLRFDNAAAKANGANANAVSDRLILQAACRVTGEIG